MTNEELQLLNSYLSNPDLLESDLRKNQGIQNIHNSFNAVSNSGKPEISKWTPLDIAELSFALTDYIAPNLKFFLSEFICEKWDFCNKKNKLTSNLVLASALFDYLSDLDQIVAKIANTMPLVLYVATLVQTDLLDEYCKCKQEK